MGENMEHLIGLIRQYTLLIEEYERLIERNNNGLPVPMTKKLYLNAQNELRKLVDESNFVIEQFKLDLVEIKQRWCS